MKKIAFLGLVLLVIFPAAVFSQAPLTGPGAAVRAAAPGERVGVVAAVRGKVEITTPGQVGRIAGSGQPVYLGDEVKTDETGRLQVLLLDETVFTIGPNSSIVIDKFVYDPETAAGEVNAKIVKGTFRFITGKIAHKKPSSMKVDLPAGTIGIRGTIVIGQTIGQQTTAGLAGPGANNNAGYSNGGFYMANEGPNGTETTDIDNTGFGAQIPGAGQGTSNSFQISDSLMNQWNSQLNLFGNVSGGGGTGGGSGSGGGAGGSSAGGPGLGNVLGDLGSATENGGQDVAGAGDVSNQILNVTNTTNNFTQETDQTAQYSADETIIEAHTSSSSSCGSSSSSGSSSSGSSSGSIGV